MSWENALQVFSSCLAGLAGWFLFDLVREFKSFKKETGTDISTLKLEREKFQLTIRNSELSMSARVADLQRLHDGFSLQVTQKLADMRFELQRAKEASIGMNAEAKKFGEYMERSFKLSSALNEKMKSHDKEIQSIKIRIDDITIFKSQKESK